MINLIAAVKMPNPEGFDRNTARTEFVELDRRGATVACLRIDDKMRWCYDHIPPQGSRAEMLRVRNEPVGGIQVGHLFHYVVDTISMAWPTSRTTKMILRARSSCVHCPVFFFFCRAW